MFKRQSGHTHTTKCEFPLVCGGDIVWKQNGEKIHTQWTIETGLSSFSRKCK